MMNSFVYDLVNVGIGICSLLVILVVGAFLFSKLTRFDDVEEIRSGNEAAGIYMGSKLLGLAIIVAMVSFSSINWIEMFIWSFIGMIVLSLVYLVFDFLTPAFKVCDEIAKGNKAVAKLLGSIIIGTSIVIGTFLM
jgi:putative membrane protein